MRLLVVCHHNAGRSQIAGAIFRGRRPEWDVVTAGTGAIDGAPMAGDVVASVREIGYDIPASTRRVLLTDELFDSADVVVMITAKDTWPDYVVGDKVVFWDIDDPQGLGQSALEGARAQLIERVGSYLNDGSA